MEKSSQDNLIIDQSTRPCQGVDLPVDPSSGRGELAVSGSTRAVGGESSPTPEGGSTSIYGAGRLELPEALGGVDGWTAGGVSSSLDTCHQVGISVAEIKRQEAKNALVEALWQCGRTGESLSVNECGSQYKVGQCAECGRYPAFPVTCKHRLCPACSARRGAVLVSEHSELLRRMHYPKMLTLTFLSVAHIDKAYIQWARGCFNRLRHRKVFAGCWGGLYSFEVTYTKGVGWHLHLHALLGSSYIKQDDLAREWQAISGACVVDIRAVKGKDKWGAIKEVVKYPAKSASFVGSPELVDEWLRATSGVCLAYGFGSLYRVRSKRGGGGGMRCPVCGGVVAFNAGAGFKVGADRVTRVRGGYLWLPP